MNKTVKIAIAAFAVLIVISALMIFLDTSPGDPEPEDALEQVDETLEEYEDL